MQGDFEIEALNRTLEEENRALLAQTNKLLVQVSSAVLYEHLVQLLGRDGLIAPLECLIPVTL